MKCAKCGTAERRPKDSYCRECRRTYQREWARNNPVKTKKYRDRLARRIKAGQHVPGESGPGKPGRPKAEQ